MALIHEATLRPTKLELLSAWLPGRGWYASLAEPAGEVRRVATFRFDDPQGAVGMETLLVRTGDGPVYQVPLTYRDAPLSGADEWLVGTCEHSVLGKRWIYDACGDVVYVAALTRAILENSGQAPQFTQVGERVEPREPSMDIASNGSGVAKVPDAGAIQRVTDAATTVIVTDTVELTLVRRVGDGADLAGVVLTGTWPGQETPVPLASASVRLA